MNTTPKPSRAKHLAPAKAARPDVPHTFKLPDGRVVYAEVPGHMTTERDGEIVFLPAAMSFLDRVQALAMKLDTVPRPAHLAALRDALSMTQEQFGAALGVNKLTVSRWERGELKPGPSSLKRLRKLRDMAARRGVVVG